MVSIIKKEIQSHDLQSLVPKVGAGRHKGQNGKIGIIGGSFEYTGAPYYVGAAILRGGGDLSHIFCTEKAATAIKSYSPEIIVHPYLLSEQDLKKPATKDEIKNCVNSITEWYKPLHAVSIGSGLGRDNAISECIEDLFTNLKDLITVCDGDFFYFLAEKNKDSLAEKVKKRSKLTVLTPNKVEFQRVWKYLKGDQEPTSDDDIKKELEKISESKAFVVQLPLDNPIVKDQVEVANKLQNVTLLVKGQVDIITNGKEAYIVKKSGCMKRCGGQGDVMSGLTALYCYWDSLEQKDRKIEPDSDQFSLVRGCMLASYMTRYSAALAYDKYRYGLTTPHILEEVHNAINTFVDKGLV